MRASGSRVDEIQASQRAMMRKECGDGADPDASNVEDARTTIASAKAAGLTPRQYAMLRERVMGFAALAHKHNPENYQGYRFSAAERSALESRRAKADVLFRDETEGMQP
jgi:hypothetical protein